VKGELSAGHRAAQRPRDAGRRVACWLGLTAVLGCSCGYQAVYAGRARPRLHVKLVRAQIPDAVASEEVTAGLRETLARAGLLEGGDGFPRVEVEVLRADEASEGIAARGGAPRAQATDVGIAARAWLVSAAGGRAERDTGDMRAEGTVAVDETAGNLNPQASEFHQADALRAAARRLGRRLAHKVIGEPATSEDGSEDR
jgi:hypothetical protein